MGERNNVEDHSVVSLAFTRLGVVFGDLRLKVAGPKPVKGQLG